MHSKHQVKKKTFGISLNIPLATIHWGKNISNYVQKREHHSKAETVKFCTLPADQDMVLFIFCDEYSYL